jgi:hypothetical protein
MSYCGGDHLLFLVFVQGVEFAIRAEDKEAVDSAGDKPVQEPSETGQVEIFIRLHRGGNGRDNSTDLHNNLHRNKEPSNTKPRVATETRQSSIPDGRRPGGPVAPKLVSAEQSSWGAKR